MDYTEERVRVTSSSTIKIKSIIYSVPSRLIGETLKVHVYDDRLECFVGAIHTVTIERVRKRRDYVHRIDYRHLMDGLNGTETSLLFELISDRYERRSIVITCNQPFQQWDAIFEDKQMAIAAVDRLIHHGVVLELCAESYRKRTAQQRFKKESKKG